MTLVLVASKLWKGPKKDQVKWIRNMFHNILKENILGRTESVPTRVQPKRNAASTEVCKS